ncbi:efflux RND transporter periplasmic adaptor subunit [Burkholderia sp. JKS000303]|uniref:efflux RND transporter periplasmic adaptor subunit n=1 Tax=Burkholderia sp. JKS000303 TaxID=1938747 RepID=UPI000C01AB3F|nr:efflux RND transporter periplasmic adaptor subunit [Burkholderia sp. JKS000303]PFH20686.1 membrane fusion protein (multidrug efflux system) [Burkholderia sp. JKS000303]
MNKQLECCRLRLPALSGPASPTRTTRWPVMLALFASLALAGCGDRGAATGPGAAPAAVEVGVQTLALQRIDERTALSGRLSALQVSDVRPQIGGIVRKRLFTEGADVKAGQVLYLIDPAAYQATYDQARGTLAKAEATLASANTKAARYAQLAKIGAVSAQDNDDAVAAVREDEADVLADRASLESARVNLGYTRITAPIAGRIGASSVTEGALVTADQTTALATIQAYDRMYLDVTRSSAEWLRLRKAYASGRLQRAGDGAVVRLTMEDGTPYPHDGVLQFSGITVDQTTGSVTLRIIFPNPDGELLPGMFVRAQLDEGVDANALLVPQLAVTRASDGSASVWVVDATGHAKQVAVRADNAYRDQWIVSSGLKAGDRVIVDGLQKVQAGTAVHVAAATSAAKP